MQVCVCKCVYASVCEYECVSIYACSVPGSLLLVFLLGKFIVSQLRVHRVPSLLVFSSINRKYRAHIQSFTFEELVDQVEAENQHAEYYQPAEQQVEKAQSLQIATVVLIEIGRCESYFGIVMMI